MKPPRTRFQRFIFDYELMDAGITPKPQFKVWVYLVAILAMLAFAGWIDQV